MSSQIKQTGVFTSFRKKGADSLHILGTRVSQHNAQLLTSTGSSTLDFFIGGGLAIGTVCLIEEDRFSSYSNLLLKYFLAEGVANNHKLFLSSGDKPSKSILKDLPSIKVPELKQGIKSDEIVQNENLKIAWRYQRLPISNEASNIRMNSQNHGYDLSKPIPEDVMEMYSTATWDPDDNYIQQIKDFSRFLTFPYSFLLERIKEKIISSDLRTSSNACDNIMRIGVCSLGSPLWNSNGLESSHELHLVRFLCTLKSLLRKSYAVAFITIPAHLLQNMVLVSRIRQTCDTVIRLESFVGSDKKSNPLFKEFDGLLHIVKLPVLNTYVYPFQTSDLAFKLKRRDFLIERLHLPPDFEDSPVGSSHGCSGQPTKLDF